MLVVASQSHLAHEHAYLLARQHTVAVGVALNEQAFRVLQCLLLLYGGGITHGVNGAIAALHTQVAVGFQAAGV